MAFEYIERFKKMGFGLFCHFGLYSAIGRGEWALEVCRLDKTEYNNTIEKFEVAKDWAKRLVKTAKDAGCKYITLTTRHHDGFSLYDTCGLNEFDAPHSACGRDLIKEFVDECNAEGIIPFFYHTLLDWYNPDYNENFPKYIDYLIQSVEILCKNYGKIGGLWFDGFWSKPHENWQFDRLYATIRKYQPEAMIINNTGLEERGRVGHPEIDSVTFERGKPLPVDTSEKPIAGEMCDGITDHWGFAAGDLRFKSIPTILESLVDCRKYNCNLLLNVGPTADGTLTGIETETLKYVGKWVAINKDVVYEAVPSNLEAEGAVIMQRGEDYYALIYDVPMYVNANVTDAIAKRNVKIHTDKTITDAVWLDNGKPIDIIDNQTFFVKPFEYGVSLHIRVAKFKLK